MHVLVGDVVVGGDEEVGEGDEDVECVLWECDVVVSWVLVVGTEVGGGRDEVVLVVVGRGVIEEVVASEEADNEELDVELVVGTPAWDDCQYESAKRCDGTYSRGIRLPGCGGEGFRALWTDCRICCRVRCAVQGCSCRDDGGSRKSYDFDSCGDGCASIRLACCYDTCVRGQCVWRADWNGWECC